eukprot:TRINITY_DN6453_c0_g1_i1.p1 TRINITY_DN6453_c0_g1~~TRINITY_DN6453_c0_g1_i1.p1  ORF type:complete len:1133 (+),score=323.86 TRINITY_DN6453_c0_g1_i1:100-3498(+)
MAQPTQVAQQPGGLGAPDQMQQLAKCKIWEKIKRGEIHCITKDNVAELHSVLDTEEQGEVSTQDLEQLQMIPELNMSQQDIEDLMRDCDADGSGKVSVDELYKAITTGSIAFKKMIVDLNRTGASKLKENECSREDLLGWMEEEYETNSALWSLPQTFFLFMLFFITVTAHLDIWTCHIMQDSLFNGVSGEGAPFLYKYIHDIPSMWDWMDTSFLSVTLKNDLANFPYPGRLESYNQIIGGIQLKKTDIPRGECNQAVPLQMAYEGVFAGCHANMPAVEESRFILYHEKSEETAYKFQQWREEVWMSQNTSLLDHHILFFNAYLGAFTDYHLLFWFEHNTGKKDGIVEMQFSQETFLSDPYRSKWIVIFDGLLIFILVRMFVLEMFELGPAMMNGPDGFMDYWDFWNAVDWISLTLCFVNIGFWIKICLDVSGPLQEMISALPSTKLDTEIFIKKEYLTKDELDELVDRESFETQITELHEYSYGIASNVLRLRQIVFFNSIVLMMKFFKAFRANPRLNVVIKTITESTVDLVHFMVVFIVIFLVFSIMGYVMFGAAIKTFASQQRSFMMCWRVLMGEDIVEDMEEHVGTFWTWCWVMFFQFFVGLILLNMTVAIIMDAYTQVQTQGGMAIWTQVAMAVKTIRETRGFINMWYIICEFKDDEEPAHPGPRVTSRSLRRAFDKDKMTKSNAEYLLRKAQEWVREKAGEQALSLTDAIRVIGQVRTYSLKCNVTVDLILDMLKEQKRAPQEARFDAILAGEDPDAPLKGQMGGMNGSGMGMNGHNHMHNNQNGMTNGMHGNMPTNGFGHTPTITNGFPVNHSPLALQDANGFGGAGGMGGNMSMGQSLPGMTNAAGMNGAIVPAGTQMNAHPNAGGMMAGTMDMHAQSGGMGGMPMMGSGAAAAAAAMQQQQAMLQMQAIQRLQATVDHLRVQIQDFSQTADTRHTWLEQRVFALERRSERVEKASDQLRGMFQELDLEALVNVPKKAADAVELRVSKEMHRLLSGASNPTGLQGDETPAMRGSPQEMQRRLEHRIDKIAEQMGTMVAQTDEIGEIRKALWRLDVAVRQIKQAPAPAPQTGQSNRPSSHQGPPGSGSFARQGPSQGSSHGSNLQRTSVMNDPRPPSPNDPPPRE